MGAAPSALEARDGFAHQSGQCTQIPVRVAPVYMAEISSRAGKRRSDLPPPDTIAAVSARRIDVSGHADEATSVRWATQPSGGIWRRRFGGCLRHRGGYRGSRRTESSIRVASPTIVGAVRGSVRAPGNSKDATAPGGPCKLRATDREYSLLEIDVLQLKVADFPTRIPETLSDPTGSSTCPAVTFALQLWGCAQQLADLPIRIQIRPSSLWAKRQQLSGRNLGTRVCGTPVSREGPHEAQCCAQVASWASAGCLAQARAKGT